MRKEFEVLKQVLFNSNTYDQNGNCNWSEVSNLLEKLGDKIDEVGKRIECAVRSSAEANKSILLYTKRVDNNETFQMNVDDHDSILRGTNDVLIALDMDDTECIENNWYWLFQPYEEPKPIAVGNIEYEFPEEVYTIGNADNTEIIGDVYESMFHELLDLGILVLEGSDDFTSGKANYIVLDNKFISIVKKKQIDLSKVPIKKEVFVSFESDGVMKTTEEKNRMIAKFMGFKDLGNLVGGSPRVEKHVRGITYQSYPYSELNYHTSWDWLMPVVKKCSIEAFALGADTAAFLADYGFQSAALADIDQTYVAVVKFIEWYNENK